MNRFSEREVESDGEPFEMEDISNGGKIQGGDGFENHLHI